MVSPNITRWFHGRSIYNEMISRSVETIMGDFIVGQNNNGWFYGWSKQN